MTRPSLSRTAWKVPSLGLLAVFAALGCSLSTPGEPQPEQELGIIPALAGAYRNANGGRIVGAVTLSAEVQQALGGDFTGAKAQAFDPDGTPLGEPVDLTAQGQFLMSGLRDSRPRVFVEVIAKNLRFRATTLAPREPRDYPVLLDPGSTFLADKLRRAALDHQVPFDRLDDALVDQTEEVVNTYMPETDRGKVLLRLDPDLNAYAFDHFMDDNVAVKVAVYALAPALTRGWKPVPSLRPIPLSPAPTPRRSPSPSPVASADPNASDPK